MAEEKEIHPHVVKLREDAAGWRREGGPELTPDEPFLTGLDEETANGLAGSQWAIVHSTVEEAKKHRYGTPSAPFEPSDLTVSDLKAKLGEEEFTRAELDALYEAEENADDPRTTALDAIEETPASDEPVSSASDEAEADAEADADGDNSDAEAEADAEDEDEG